ncbi:DUF1127 domain-containing protein [Alphaproteobacteria bacterium GH1-50]|uniref:DUF1127 domain-containing protein n=1 Tax=Kangsaoukella pontilimi TaxID=2691042 RepID=A0A7C9IHL3_9RHOB|nr:DUF1127 domain-containing protein [Kangsaoukella pontilimi]MXQ08707.1 DUF1127 domain-containing protein [Kangsaoukella pontilimi]
MALLDDPRAAGRPAVLSDTISRAAYRIASAIMEWHSDRRTRKALLELSPEELDDIGLTRADLDKMLRRTGY